MPELNSVNLLGLTPEQISNISRQNVATENQSLGMAKFVQSLMAGRQTQELNREKFQAKQLQDQLSNILRSRARTTAEANAQTSAGSLKQTIANQLAVDTDRDAARVLQERRDAETVKQNRISNILSNTKIQQAGDKLFNAQEGQGRIQDVIAALSGDQQQVATINPKSSDLAKSILNIQLKPSAVTEGDRMRNTKQLDTFGSFFTTGTGNNAKFDPSEPPDVAGLEAYNEDLNTQGKRIHMINLPRSGSGYLELDQSARSIYMILPKDQAEPSSTELRQWLKNFYGYSDTQIESLPWNERGN